MAWFECTVGKGGESIPLIVTCASAFAGLTITCSDGTTTLTQQCPGSSPYEVTFNLPNTGTWDVSGTISGVTYTESIVVQDLEIELKDSFTVTVDVYSAANDTVSYVGIDGQTHTITTDSSGHANATITAIENQPITFSSSVAKDLSNLTQAYTKAIALNPSTSAIYIMPTSGNKMLYWYGYKGAYLQDLSTANGWTPTKNSGGTSYTFVAPTHNTNDILFNNTASLQTSGVGMSNTINYQKLHFVGENTVVSSGYGMTFGNRTGKNMADTTQDVNYTQATAAINTLGYYVSDAGSQSNYYGYAQSGNANRRGKLNALWVE